MFWVAYYAKIWIYPVLEVLGWRDRLVFLIACWLLVIVCYFVGELLTSVLWRECLSPHYHLLYSVFSQSCGLAYGYEV